MKYRFDEIAVNIKEKKKPTEEDRHHYIGLEHLDSGSLKVSWWGSAVPIKGEKLIMHKGDILFAKRNAYLRRVAIAPHDGLFSAHGMILKPNEDVVDKKFFPMFISSDYFFDRAIKISVGSLSPTINWRDLARQEFELPPIEKQRELADVLWSIEDTRTAYQELATATEELVKSRFVEVFGDTIYNPHEFDEELLADLADIVSGITKGRKTKDSDLIEVPYMSVANVKSGYIEWANIKTILATKKEIEQYRLIPNDILMTEGGDPDKLGRGALITEVPRNCIHQNHIYRVRFRGNVNPVYFEAYLQEAKAKRDFLRCAKQTTGIASVNMTQLKSCPVIVPPPIALQNQFADFVQLTDKSKLVVKETLEKIAAMKAAIMIEGLR